MIGFSVQVFLRSIKTSFNRLCLRTDASEALLKIKLMGFSWENSWGGWLGVRGVAWGPSEFPKPPWAGPERHPTTQRTDFSLMAISLGIRRGRL